MDTIVSAFQGAMISDTVSSIDKNHSSVLLLLLSQGQRVPLLGLQREEAGAQLADSMVREELPALLQSLHNPLGEQGHDGTVGRTQRNANRMCV